MEDNGYHIVQQCRKTIKQVTINVK